MSVIYAGFDEAGYGPKLGPLTVGYSAFEVTDVEPGQAANLWERLEGAVRRTAKGDPTKVWVADSKAIKPKKNGLKNLELGVLAFRDNIAGSLPELLGQLGQTCDAYGRLPWYEELAGVKVPSYCWPGEVASRAERLRETCEKNSVRYLGAGVRVLDVPRYNRRIAATRNKGQVLGETCVELLKSLRASTEGPLAVTVDKHGGRTTYLRLLGAALPMCKLDIITEGPKLSVYRAETKRGQVWVRFCQGAEDLSLAAALASMHCKYLRELFMDQLNAWFQERIPGLKKTAGYAQDAKRFLADVGERLPDLGVNMDTLVRER